MSLPFPQNDGDRPSRLQLARYATEELDGAERAAIERWLAEHPEGRAYLDGLEAAREQVALFDAEGLRHRASSVAGEPPSVPPPANRPFRLRWLIPILVAALALLVMLPRRIHEPSETARTPLGVRIKGDAALLVYRLQGGTLVPYEGQALGQGDVVGFRVNPAGHEQLVLLSVDGTGTATVFYPQAGETEPPLPAGDADVALPLTVTLDGAPGPEVFVALFDTDPAQARAGALAAWNAGGAAGLEQWAHAQHGDAAPVEKK